MGGQTTSRSAQEMRPRGRGARLFCSLERGPRGATLPRLRALGAHRRFFQFLDVSVLALRMHIDEREGRPLASVARLDGYDVLIILGANYELDDRTRVLVALQFLIFIALVAIGIFVFVFHIDVTT